MELEAEIGEQKIPVMTLMIKAVGLVWKFQNAIVFKKVQEKNPEFFSRKLFR